MYLGIAGRRALVLGGSRGLGFAIASRLAAEGAIVGVVGRDRTALQNAVSTLGLEAVGIAHDLSNAAALPDLLARVERDLGSPDILVLNGGGPPPSRADAFDPRLWHEQLDALVLSGMGVAAGLLPAMRRRGWGRILAVGSTSVREPIPGLTLSNALRAALAGWAKTLASEVAPDGVTVNLLLPGRLATDRTTRLDGIVARERGLAPEVVAAESQAEIPAGRYGDPDEFGAVAAFLASDLAAYVTGAAIPVDGGLSRGIL